MSIINNPADTSDLGTGHANTELDNLGTTAINASLLVDTDSSYDIGSSTKFLANVYTDGIRLESSGDTLITGHSIANGTEYRFYDDDASPQYFSISINQLGYSGYVFGGSGTNRYNFGGDLVPATPSTDHLGIASLYWNATYTDKLFLNSTATLDGTSAGILISTGDIVPSIDNTDDLGGTAKRWKDLYLSGNISDDTNTISVTEMIGHSTKELDNLGTTAVNASIIPDTLSTYDLGSSSKEWNYIYGTRLIAGTSPGSTAFPLCVDEDGSGYSARFDGNVAIGRNPTSHGLEVYNHSAKFSTFDYLATMEVVNSHTNAARASITSLSVTVTEDGITNTAVPKALGGNMYVADNNTGYDSGSLYPTAFSFNIYAQGNNGDWSYMQMRGMECYASPRSGYGNSVDRIDGIKFLGNSQGTVVTSMNCIYAIPDTTTRSTTLNGALSGAETTITVTATTGFPDTGTITYNSSDIAYTAKTATTFTVGSAHASAGSNDAVVVKGVITTMRGIYISPSLRNGAITNAYSINIDDFTYATNCDAIRIETQNDSGASGKGNINMVGGDWNTGHLQLENGHIWNDPSGNVVRIHAAAPASTTDAPIHIGVDSVSFYGTTTPIVQQTGVAVSAAGVHAALVNLGLITA